eukprot:TRINITY_DN42966_c0_g1_i1.p1 TRINITY_DN42966_c0_g1~~TRINITY_DN42966_c0_g1_i1.p1  ORF type:complete len:907 (+),score=305.18 TRINITY_DN42966_c0_g1_i1:55-2721(+)
MSERVAQIRHLIQACVRRSGGDAGAERELVAIVQEGFALPTLEVLKQPLKKESDPEGQHRAVNLLDTLVRSTNTHFQMQIASERWMNRLIQVAKATPSPQVRARIEQCIVDWEFLFQRNSYLRGFSQYGVQRLRQSKTLSWTPPSQAVIEEFEMQYGGCRGSLPPPASPSEYSAAPRQESVRSLASDSSTPPQAAHGVKLSPSPPALSPGQKTKVAPPPLGVKTMPRKLAPGVAPSGWQGASARHPRDAHATHRTELEVSDMEAFMMDVGADISALQVGLMRPEMYDPTLVEGLEERLQQIEMVLQREHPEATVESLAELRDNIRVSVELAHAVGGRASPVPGASPAAASQPSTPAQMGVKRPPAASPDAVPPPTSVMTPPAARGKGPPAIDWVAGASAEPSSEIERLRTALREKEANEQRLQRELDEALSNNERLIAENDGLGAREGALRAAAGKCPQSIAAAIRAHAQHTRRVVERCREDALQLSLQMEQGMSFIGTRMQQALTAAEQLAKQPSHDKLIRQLQENYIREMKLRKKYYNDLQDMRGNIRVYCRVRPLIAKETEEGHRDITAFGSDPEINDMLIVQGDDREKRKYEFDRVFRTDEQQDAVFQDTRPLIESVVDGYNVCIFAYGQTGSGKTYTMEGPPENPGVNKRALRRLFEVIEERKETDRSSVSLSVLEIYNESIRDLLVDQRLAKERKYEVKSNGDTGMYVSNLEYFPVESLAEIKKYCDMAHKNRSQGKTNMNEYSSRSHMILYFVVQTENISTGNRCYGKLSLIDLAGSERLKKSLAEGQRAEEAKCINLSLTTLGKVVQAIGHKQSHVPYRESKLTHLLQDSLGGQSKVLMFANISPASYNIDETVSTLKFATGAREVALGKAQKNVTKGRK